MPNAYGPQGFDAAFKILKQRVNAADNGVVNAHRNHHRAAAHTRDDVGKTDDNAAQNVKKRFHIFFSPHNSVFCVYGLMPVKINYTISSMTWQTRRNIFFAIVSVRAVFVNPFFENLTSA